MMPSCELYGGYKKGLLLSSVDWGPASKYLPSAEDVAVRLIIISIIFEQPQKGVGHPTSLNHWYSLLNMRRPKSFAIDISGQNDQGRLRDQTP